MRLWGFLVALAACGGSGDGLTVSVDTGTLHGGQTGSIRHFLGIPYAAPPVGDLRWRPPQPAEPWSGTRQALQVLDQCPQSLSYSGPSNIEDCLFLNVWSSRGRARPAGDGVAARRRVHLRQRRRSLLRGRSPRREGGRRRHAQLPARRVRLHGAAAARHRGSRLSDLRQLRPRGPARRARVGAAQHRRVRRRPQQGDAVRRVGRRVLDVRAVLLVAHDRSRSAPRSSRAACAARASSRTRTRPRSIRAPRSHSSSAARAATSSRACARSTRRRCST